MHLDKLEEGDTAGMVSLGGWEKDICYIRMQVCEAKDVSFDVSEDGIIYKIVGKTTTAAPGRWVGVKVGLAAISDNENSDGSAYFDYFIFDK